MPTTITQAFSTLRKNLEITHLQSDVVSTRQQNVRDAVATEMTVLTSFLTGSYRRSTMIAPLKDADVDVFVVLGPSYFEQNGQSSLLDKVKRVLRKTYSKTPEISRAGRAITITFSDFKVDVVPAFHRNGGGYLIPDAPQDGWISTDPTKHVEIWSSSNKAHNGDLVPLIKMIKAWNREHGGFFESFHLETIVLNTLMNVTISNFPSGCRYVFDKARSYVNVALSDPAGYSGSIGSMSESDRQAVASRLESAYTRALAAEKFEASGYTSSAFEKWRLIFGDYFPAYG